MYIILPLRIGVHCKKMNFKEFTDFLHYMLKKIQIFKTYFLCNFEIGE